MFCCYRKKNSVTIYNSQLRIRKGHFESRAKERKIYKRRLFLEIKSDSRFSEIHTNSWWWNYAHAMQIIMEGEEETNLANFQTFLSQVGIKTHRISVYCPKEKDLESDHCSNSSQSQWYEGCIFLICSITSWKSSIKINNNDKLIL